MRKALNAIVILGVFFIVFHVRAVEAYFAQDEMMNIFQYWNPPWWKVVLADLAFWSKFVRPMGALYYLPLYEMFGLNPLPYNLVRLLLLAVNTALFYLLAKRISRSWWTATIAALPVAYHAGMAFLAYRGSFIFDILCAGFYFTAILYYLRHRRTGARFGIPQTCLFLALYVCALNSKEMAVSLPVIILTYELLFHASRPKLIPLIAAIAITAVFIAGRTLGQGTLTDSEAYRPVFTWARFAESNTRFLNTLFYSDRFVIEYVLALWAGILVFAGVAQKLYRDPRWMFWLVWVVVTPLPITFLPGRGGAMLYIPAAGWAMLTAMAIRSLAWRVAKLPFIALQRRVVMAIVLAVSVVLYSYETWMLEKQVVAATLASGAELKRFVRDLNGLSFRPAGHSHIVFLNDPFPDGYTTEFAAYLDWKDRSLDIILQRQVHFSPDVIARMDYVFDFTDGHLVVRKPGL